MRTQQENHSRSANTRVSAQTLMRRIHALQYAGPCLSLSFLLVWLPWLSHAGVQFAVALLVYDSALTYVDLNFQVNRVGLYSVCLCVCVCVCMYVEAFKK